MVNWEALTAFGQLVAAAGVIASLLYLAVQVRDSTRASAAQTKLAFTRLLTDFIDGFIQSPELNDIWRKGRKDLDSLSLEEYSRFSNMSLKAFWFFSAGYFQFRHGTLSDNDWFELRAVLRSWLGGEGARIWWSKIGRFMYGEEFVAFIESETVKVEALGKPA